MRFSLLVLLWIVYSHLCPTDASADDRSFLVGVNLPLTGEVAEFGVAVKNGIQLAVKEYPSEFGGIKFIFEDNRYDSKTSVTAFNKLKDLNKVDLVFVWGDTPSLAIAPVAEKRKTPLVAVLTDHTAVRKFDFVIRFINSYDQYASALVEYLRSQFCFSPGSNNDLCSFGSKASSNCSSDAGTGTGNHHNLISETLHMRVPLLT